MRREPCAARRQAPQPVRAESPPSRYSGPGLAGGHRACNDGAHPDDRLGPDHHVLAHERTRADIGATADPDEAGDEGSGVAEGDTRFDHIVVGEHDGRHYRDVRPELDVGREHCPGVDDAAGSDRR